MSGLRFDAEYLKAISAIGLPAPQAPCQDAYQIRSLMEGIFQMAMDALPRLESIQERVFTLKSYDGMEIKATRFASSEVINSPEPSAAVVYAHGGGLVSLSVDIYRPLLAALAQASGLSFFAVSYRLAPEHPAPSALEDVYAALKYVSANAGDLNVDAAKIAVMGESAGGNLAAGAALLARDRQLSPPLAKQILVYPMLDDRTKLAADDPLRNFTLVWTPEYNNIAWDAYLGEGKRGRADADIPLHAAPARAESLRGLPSTYIDVGTLDLYRDEDVAFAARLAKDQVEVELHLWPGVPHGFENARGTRWSDRALSSRIDALKRLGE